MEEMCRCVGKWCDDSMLSQNAPLPKSTHVQQSETLGATPFEFLWWLHMT